jgi:hypothetical protein
VVREDSASWQRGKQHGDVAELAVAEWFIQRGYSVYKAVGSTEPDLSIHTTVEVKRDARAAQTGNVAIEVAHGGRPSGLQTTTAVWWAVVSDDVAYVCRVSELRAWIDRTNYQARGCGDEGKAVCVLVPLADFRKQAAEVA